MARDSAVEREIVSSSRGKHRETSSDKASIAQEQVSLHIWADKDIQIQGREYKTSSLKKKYNIKNEIKTATTTTNKRNIKKRREKNHHERKKRRPESREQPRVSGEVGD